ncbi:D-aminopeptidase [Myxococcus stipitatus DSM 14675]|uniref:D-aminopeptidase n=1 Tax=Myxococcus stipitatus (strain DSM 14675 / JCM 12634 / Mx s8) TaxID=1278073 RepID=L7UDX9_MYXSD|nr:P1 family peptidase [Myxococcus stipitatus]AGC44649.1 D-aminopeptidase [Myxococcus stipitatus DSM 14675]
MHTHHRHLLSSVVASLLLLPMLASAQAERPRARARTLGITFGGETGPNNAITDVPGVEVGHTTLISGEGRIERGKGPVRTGVTAVLPRGKKGVAEPVFASSYALNGNGEMTGTHWIQEGGHLQGPVMITNTNDVGAVREAVISWALEKDLAWDLGLPVVAETWDGMLHDIYGFHVKPPHALQALESAKSGPVAEGSVGGGTGMVCHGFKGGIGTASRKVSVAAGGYTLGVLVQCNYGSRRLFTVEGVPVGEELKDDMPCYLGTKKPDSPMMDWVPACGPASKAGPAANPFEGAGSIIIVVGTDAPLLPHQLSRIARRVPLAIAKMGGLGENYSGDIFLAFSTQSIPSPTKTAVASVSSLQNEHLNPLFEATVQATQEAILNAMLASDTMTGADSIRVFGLPQDKLVKVMKKHGRLTAPPKPPPARKARP